MKSVSRFRYIGKYSDISEKHTTFIFGVTELVPADADEIRRNQSVS